MSSETSPSPALLWKQLSEPQKLQAAEAFWREADSADQQIEAMVLLAQKLKARPKFIASLPPERKAKHLAHFPGMPDVLAARLLVSYHLAHQRPMMGAFLDALGIPHDNGLINEELNASVDPETLGRGVEALRAAFPAADVTLYFETLLLQDPDTWGGLSEHVVRGSN
jgi:hypothetical protein